MSFYRIIYCSTVGYRFSGKALVSLGHQTQAQNAAVAVTGALFYAGRQFLQVLEGEQAAVEQRYARIQEHLRPTKLTVLFREPAAHGLFSTGEMALGEVSAGALARLVSYLDPRSRAALLPGHYDSQAIIADLFGEFMVDQITPRPGGPPAGAASAGRAQGGPLWHYQPPGRVAAPDPGARG